MIAAAVAAAMEKASSKYFQMEQDAPKSISKWTHYGADFEDSDSSRKHSHQPKRHWKDEAAAPRKSKRKTPAKHRMTMTRMVHEPTQISSSEEDSEPTHALAGLDEWQVVVSEQEDSDRDSAANSDPYLIREQIHW
ncbi:Hypothetical predicted protein [Pelobates cultripes]|uniref:Uncharacterized protein n=1 Tax=Pelobates cultripes TaxID=61616 RepID=A0AAD1SL91_PELCU|nr:Hypothetical predicted protein [Pelobates cultripes]